MANNLEAIITKHVDAIKALGQGLAVDFDTPAQAQINRAFYAMGLQRFDRSGNDLWERIVAHQNGWEYTKPPAHLTRRWASY